MEQNAYSLRSILESQTLNPNLCKLMLHEIKSPLLEHSFQVTADDEPEPSFTDHESRISYSHQQRAQRDSYTPTRFPDQTHNKLFESKQERSIGNSGSVRGFPEKLSLSIVSPLQHQKFLEQTTADAATDKFKQQIFQFCGQVFAPNLEQNEIVFTRDSTRARPKIFKKQHTFEQSISKLQSINELELAHFLSFLGKTMAVVSRVPMHLQKLSSNCEVVSRLLLEYNPVNYMTKQSFPNQERIKNRLDASKFSDLLFTLIQAQNQQSGVLTGISHHQRESVEAEIENLLSLLNRVEEIIEDYVNRTQTASELQTIHALLYPENRLDQNVLESSGSGMNSPYKQLTHSTTLKARLTKLLYSLKINESYYTNLSGLKFIWRFLEEPGAYSCSQDFIRDLCRNDIKIGGINSAGGNAQRRLELSGYIRNT